MSSQNSVFAKRDLLMMSWLRTFSVRSSFLTFVGSKGTEPSAPPPVCSFEIFCASVRSLSLSSW